VPLKPGWRGTSKVPWLNDVQDAVGWLAADVTHSGSPQQMQQAFQSMGTTAVDFLSWYLYYTGGTDDPFAAGRNEKFSESPLGQWLTGQHQDQQQGQSATKPATVQSQQQGAIQGFSGDPNVVRAIIKAAQDSGVDPRLALAIAQHESGFNPTAVGDHGCSKGVFQLNTCAGEGVGKPDYILNDPYSNAMVALAQVKAVQRQNPSATPGQIAAMAQRPADQAAYASAINGNMDSIATGTGTLGWAQAALQNPQLGGLGAPTNQLGGGSQVPLPFPVDYFKNVTEGYGDTFGSSREMGTDFGMPVGTQIMTPVGGTIQLRDDGKANWGKAVYVVMPNGWKFFVGHLHSFAVSNGEQVAPGGTIGVSGGDPSDPSSGNSTGPHVELQFIDPSGKTVDPMPFLNPVFAGTTFGQWANGAFLGSSQVTGQPQSLARTPDNGLVDYNTPSGQWYKTVDTVWQSVYGQHAPLQAAMDFQTSGINTVDSLQLAVNNLPSSIPGYTVGQYKAVADAAGAQAQKSLGRSIPQSLVQQFLQQGVTSASDIQLWFESHSSSQMPQGAYQQIFDSSAAYTQNLYGDVPHPSDIVQTYQNAGGAINTGSPDSVTKTINDYTAGVY